MASFDWDHPIARIVAFVGPAASVVAESDRTITDPKLWALAIAAGCTALAVLLRPPGIQKPERETRG